MCKAASFYIVNFTKVNQKKMYFRIRTDIIISSESEL
jgi:hypothetical protein